MELALIGVAVQIIALRVLVVQAASRPDDPPLLGRSAPLDAAGQDRRRQVIADRTLWAVIAFIAATVLALVGVLLMFIAS